MTYRLLRSGFALAACLSAGTVLAQPARPAGPPACRELEQRLALLATDAVSAQWNSLLFAAADSGCAALARRLLAAGASLAARDRLGAMPLSRAARAGHVPLVEMFIAQGAAIDARNLEGATALYLAVANERQATVALLLANGADPSLPGPSGVTPLAAAAFKGNGRMVDRLIARGADPDVADATGKAAMTYAAARGFAPIVRRLLLAGADAGRAYGNDLTALMWAAGRDEGVGAGAALDVIALLLDAGAPLDAVDDRGRTALMIAAELGHGEVVEALLARGADRAIRDKGGKRAVDLAAGAGVRARLLAE
jgi:ankyrin repeat protein